MIDDKHEYEWQQQAITHPRTDRDAPAEAAVDRYRLVYRAIREAPLPDLPVGFALEMERITQDQAEPARAVRSEAWVIRVAFVVAVVAAVASALPVVTRAWALVGSRQSDVPWPMLLAAIGCLLLASLADRRMHAT